MEGAIDLISGRLEESEVGVGGLHFGWIFLWCLLQLVSNLNTVLFQASIIGQNSQQLTKSAELYQNEKEKGKRKLHK